MRRSDHSGRPLDEERNSSVEHLVGKELDDKYFIVRALGKGAMGVVYEALHTGIDRKLAVKVLNPDVAENEEVLERFRREARFTSKLGHSKTSHGPFPRRTSAASYSASTMAAEMDRATRRQTRRQPNWSKSEPIWNP